MDALQNEFSTVVFATGLDTFGVFQRLGQPLQLATRGRDACVSKSALININKRQGLGTGYLPSYSTEENSQIVEFSCSLMFGYGVFYPILLLIRVYKVGAYIFFKSL